MAVGATSETVDRRWIGIAHGRARCVAGAVGRTAQARGFRNAQPGRSSAHSSLGRGGPRGTFAWRHRAVFSRRFGEDLAAAELCL